MLFLQKQYKTPEMGLDITHYKAILERPVEISRFDQCYILASEFKGFDVEIDYFQPYIQLIDTPESLKTIIFPKSEHEIEEVTAFYTDTDCIILLEQDITKIERRLSDYLSEKKLHVNSIRRWETDKWFRFEVYKFEKQIGFYCESVGEQRKGMNKKFWTRFQSDEIFCYTQQADFEFAYDCVGFYWDSDTKEEVQQRKKNFKENFVDKYEPHRSWMELSY
jgi:hypothetical protein